MHSLQILSFIGAAQAAALTRRDNIISSSFQSSSFNLPFGTIQSGVTAWLTGGTFNPFQGDISNNGNIVCSSSGQSGSVIGSSAQIGNLINNGLISLNAYGLTSVSNFDWSLQTLQNKGSLQFCGQGSSGGSNFNIACDSDSYNYGLIDFGEYNDNQGSSCWKNSAVGLFLGRNIYNEGAFRLANIVHHNVQNVLGSGCWVLDAGAVLYLESGSVGASTGIFPFSSVGPSLPNQKIFFTDAASVAGKLQTIHLDSGCYSQNSNFGPSIYGFGAGKAIEFSETIRSFSYNSGVLKCIFTSGNQVNLNIGVGYDASQFYQGSNPQNYNTAGFNAIFYRGGCPSQQLPQVCSVSLGKCGNPATTVTSIPTTSTTTTRVTGSSSTTSVAVTTTTSSRTSSAVTTSSGGSTTTSTSQSTSTTSVRSTASTITSSTSSSAPASATTSQTSTTTAAVPTTSASTKSSSTSASTSSSSSSAVTSSSVATTSAATSSSIATTSSVVVSTTSQAASTSSSVTTSSPASTSTSVAPTTSATTKASTASSPTSSSAGVTTSSTVPLSTSQSTTISSSVATTSAVSTGTSATATSTVSTSSIVYGNGPCAYGAQPARTYTTKNGDVYGVCLNTDFSGGDFTNVGSITDVNACAEACSQTPGCVDSSFLRGANTCYLKNTLTSASANSGVDSVYKISGSLSSSTGGYTTPTSSAQSTGSTVMSTTSGTGATSSTTSSAPVSSSTTSSGAVSTSPVVTTSSAAATTSTATSVSTSSSAATTKPAGNGPCANGAGPDRMYTAPNGDVYGVCLNTDFSGGNLNGAGSTVSGLSTPEQCADACSKTAGCVAGNIVHGGTCYLKSSLTPASPNSNVDGVYKISSGSTTVTTSAATTTGSGSSSSSATSQGTSATTSASSGSSTTNQGTSSATSAATTSSQTGTSTASTSSSPSTTKPAGNGPCANGAGPDSIVTTTNGDVFGVCLNTDFSGGDISNQGGITSPKDLAEACSTISTCVAASDIRSSGQGYFKNQQNPASYNGNVDSVYLISSGNGSGTTTTSARPTTTTASGTGLSTGYCPATCQATVTVTVTATPTPY